MRRGLDRPGRGVAFHCAASKRHHRKEHAVLVLTRKVGERIQIGDSIVVTVVRIQSEKVRIGIEAPPEVSIFREEVFRRNHPDGVSGRTRPASVDN
jgi:carbon storage regulator